MNDLTDRIFNFFKEEIIFSISLILAIISCFFVLPNADYFNYINWETIILLFVIMVFVEILKNLSVFEILVRKLLTKVKNTRGLVLFLVFTCFFSSIFITNDVSLIIFVPFGILALMKVDRADLIILTVSLQTIAANVGCMVLPIGAPHNIVMYTVSHIPFESFFLLLLPYVIVSVVFLIALSFFIPRDDVKLPKLAKIEIDRKDFLKRVFCGVDYFLGNEVIWGVVASQFISNVPAAMLLSGFSTNYEAIIVGINIGGLGTLIASMANLISYKILVREFNEFKIRYLIVFTVLNIVLLFILFGVYVLIG